jgi:hypothetical protein
MYEIDYYVDDKYGQENSSIFHNINSNYLPQPDDDVTIDGVHYKVIEVQHILNTVKHKLMLNIEEKFIVTVHRKN